MKEGGKEGGEGKGRKGRKEGEGRGREGGRSGGGEGREGEGGEVKGGRLWEEGGKGMGEGKGMGREGGQKTRSSDFGMKELMRTSSQRKFRVFHDLLFESGEVS